MNISNNAEIKITSDNLEIIKLIFQQMNIPFEFKTTGSDKENSNQTLTLNSDSISNSDLNSDSNSDSNSNLSLGEENVQKCSLSAKNPDQLNSNDLDDADDSFDILENDPDENKSDNASPIKTNTTNKEKCGFDLESDNSNNSSDSDDFNEADLDCGSDNSTPINHFISEQFIKQQLLKKQSDTSSIEDKITLNVGGKKFHFNEKLLKRLNIRYDTLHKTTSLFPVYFLDKDPYYFSQIIEIIRKHGTNSEDIIRHIDDCSEQLISELCFYTLLNKKYLPKPKLKLKRSVGFIDGLLNGSNIIKVLVKKQLFHTSVTTLSRSNYFNNKLKLIPDEEKAQNAPFSNPDATISVNDIDIDPKLFRYILNFLRQKEMYVNNPIIENYLSKFGIEYDVIENKKIHQNIVSHYEPYNTITLAHQLNEIPDTFRQQMDSFEVENINIINTQSKIEFGSDILFDLGGNNFGDLITDLLLCIDVPVLKPTDNIEYIDLFEYQLVEDLNLIITDHSTSKHKVLLSSANHYQYIYPIIYTKNSPDYHQMTKLDGQKMKILYQDNLIDINRITIPLFLFRSKKNSLPIKQICATNKSAHLIVKTTSIGRILKNNSDKPITDMPLLNICLVANYTNISGEGKVQNTPPNINSYIYDRLHTTIIPIQVSTNPIYDTTIIPLTKVGFVKDFFFTIVSKEDYLSNRIDKFRDELIELEILYVYNNDLVLHSRLGANLMNTYIPLKKLGHKLPSGIYYHSFSSNPLDDQITGGLWGKNYILRIKTKKLDGIIKFYSTEYFEQSF